MIAGESPEAVAGYNRIGASVVSFIEEGLSMTGRSLADVEAFLDFGSGYGRVTRTIVQKIDPNKVSVFDVDPGATAFCAQEFNVKPINFRNPNRWDYKRVPFEQYDVIWLGSVLTHLSKSYSKEVLTLISEILKPGGLLIFTIHGDQTFPRLQEGYYGDHLKELAPGIMYEYRETGFSFVPYQDYEIGILPFEFVRANDFGMTWMSQSYVDALIKKVSKERLTLLKYEPLGWDNHQDVYSYHYSK